MNSLAMAVQDMSLSVSESDFQKFNGFITIKERQTYTEHYNRILKYFVDNMKLGDPLFNTIYNRHELGGSYADNLKVSKPNEFDTVIVLKIIKNNKGVKVVNDKPGYVRINVKDCAFQNKDLIKPLLDTGDYLLQDKTLSWMNKIVTDVLRNLKNNGNDTISESNVYGLNIDSHQYRLQFSTSGPAFTLKVVCAKEKIQFDMDLVPAFPFEGAEFWRSDRPFQEDRLANGCWLAVPKPSKDELFSNNKAFISSYAFLERELIKKRNNFKTLIRIFKKLRDTQNLKHLKSYYIKTVFLHHLHETRTVANYWEKPMSSLFCIMMIKMTKHVADGKLPFYWNRSYNMFGTLKTTQRESMHQMFIGLRRKLQHPENLVILMLTKEEQEQLKIQYRT